MAHRGVPEFRGLKISGSNDACARYDDIRHVRVSRNVNVLLMASAGIIGSGSNSGFQAINLALQFGARRIALVGFDGGGAAVHWHAPHRGGLKNPRHATLAHWRRLFESARNQMLAMGVELVSWPPRSV